MPHAIAAITPFLPLIEKLLPLITKLIDMFAGHADKFMSGEDSLDKYLENVNSDLAALKKAADEDGISGNEFTITSKVDTAEEAMNLANDLQDIVDANKGTMSPATVVAFEKNIAALKEASNRISQRGAGSTSAF